VDKLKTLVTMPFPEELMEKIAETSPQLEVLQEVARTADDVRPHMAGVQILYAWQAIPDPADAPDLRWVQLHLAGVDQVLETALYRDTDVIFTTTSGVHAVNMAEYTMMQILAFAHRLPFMVADRAAKDWPTGRWARYVPQELRGSTLGIVGYGSIGREVARLAQAFGIQVLAIKRDVRDLNDHEYYLPGTGDPTGEIPERYYPPQALKSFLKECDYVVLAVPLTSETYHLIDAEAFAAMKRKAVLVNVARGAVVDEKALIAALKEGQIGGAALDVFEQEPLPQESPLWELPNVIISPHISGLTPYYDERATDVFVNNLQRYLAGEPLLNEVKRPRGY